MALRRHMTGGIETKVTFEHYPGLVKFDVPEMTLARDTGRRREIWNVKCPQMIGSDQEPWFEHVIAAQHWPSKVWRVQSRGDNWRDSQRGFPVLILGNLTFSLNQNVCGLENCYLWFEYLAGSIAWDFGQFLQLRKC
jgi:hypothetical protein